MKYKITFELTLNEEWEAGAPPSLDSIMKLIKEQWDQTPAAGEGDEIADIVVERI